jgi:hypothetical protein
MAMSRRQFDIETARSYVNRTCAHLSLISQRATLAGSGPEPEAGAEDIVGGLDDLKSELRVLRDIARRWHRVNDKA